MSHTVKRIPRGGTAKINRYAGPVGELVMDSDTNELVLQNGELGGVRLTNKTDYIDLSNRVSVIEGGGGSGGGVPIGAVVYMPVTLGEKDENYLDADGSVVRIADYPAYAATQHQFPNVTTLDYSQVTINVSASFTAGRAFYSKASGCFLFQDSSGFYYCVNGKDIYNVTPTADTSFMPNTVANWSYIYYLGTDGTIIYGYYTGTAYAQWYIAIAKLAGTALTYKHVIGFPSGVSAGVIPASSVGAMVNGDYVHFQYSYTLSSHHYICFCTYRKSTNSLTSKHYDLSALGISAAVNAYNCIFSKSSSYLYCYFGTASTSHFAYSSDNGSNWSFSMNGSILYNFGYFASYPTRPYDYGAIWGYCAEPVNILKPANGRIVISKGITTNNRGYFYYSANNGQSWTEQLANIRSNITWAIINALWYENGYYYAVISSYDSTAASSEVVIAGLYRSSNLSNFTLQYILTATSGWNTVGAIVEIVDNDLILHTGHNTNMDCITGVYSISLQTHVGATTLFVSSSINYLGGRGFWNNEENYGIITTNSGFSSSAALSIVHYIPGERLYVARKDVAKNNSTYDLLAMLGSDDNVFVMRRGSSSTTYALLPLHTYDITTEVVLPIVSTSFYSAQVSFDGAYVSFSTGSTGGGVSPYDWYVRVK